MTEHIPDGVTEIIGDSLVDFKEVQFTPDEFNLPSYEMRREDVRDIHLRQRGVVIDAETELEVLDQPESGELNYVLIHLTGGGTELPDGTAAVAPENLAVYLQLDGNVQGGFETDRTTGGFHYKGIKLSDVDLMGLPEQYGNWFVTKATSTLYVAHYRGLRPYSHRLRLIVTNTAPQGNKASLLLTASGTATNGRTLIITDADGNSHTFTVDTSAGTSTSTVIGTSGAGSAQAQAIRVWDALTLAVIAGNLNIDPGEKPGTTVDTITITQSTRGTAGNTAVTGTFGDSTAFLTAAGGSAAAANAFDGGTAEKIFIERLEVSRRRYLALHGGSNTRGPPTQEYGL